MDWLYPEGQRDSMVPQRTATMEWAMTCNNRIVCRFHGVVVMLVMITGSHSNGAAGVSSG